MFYLYTPKNEVVFNTHFICKFIMDVFTPRKGYRVFKNNFIVYCDTFATTLREEKRDSFFLTSAPHTQRDFKKNDDDDDDVFFNIQESNTKVNVSGY